MLAFLSNLANQACLISQACEACLTSLACQAVQVHIGLGVTPEVGVVTGRAAGVATGHPLSEPCTAA